MESILTLTLNPAIDKTSVVEKVAAERKLRCGPPAYHPGGGGINVARAVTKLGGQVTAYWPCGGATGDLLKQLLDQETINHVPLEIGGLTRENLVVYEEATEQQYRFGFPGAKLTQEEIQSCLQSLQGHHPSPAYLVLSGSLPFQAEDDLYRRFVEAMPSSCRVILDTSGEPLKLGIESFVYMIKPNLRELEQLAGRSIENDRQIREVARSLIEQGKAQVIVTSLGSGGAVLTTADAHQHFRAPTVKIRSKVGAGDSTVAGIVLALAQGRSVAQAVQYGVATGAAAVMTEGTELCRREDAERLYEELTRSAKTNDGGETNG